MNIELPPGGILLGLGCDVIEVARVRGVVERQGERFLARVFTDEERAYCLAKPHPHPHLAARFAAKEAISKCFTTGIGGARMEPLVRLDEKGQALLRHVGATHVIVSLSHTETVAMATAALVRA